MTNVTPMDGTEEFNQCSGCLRSSEETDIYKIEVGKTIRQTSVLKLCRNCLKELNMQINKAFGE